MEKIKSETQFQRVVLDEFTPNGLQKRIQSLFKIILLTKVKFSMRTAE